MSRRLVFKVAKSSNTLGAAFKKHRLSLRGPQLKAVWECLSERDETAEICLGANGAPEPDSELRDIENVSFGEDIDTYFDKEVRPYVPDAWMDRGKDRIGYEIPFTRYFYRFIPPRPLKQIDADLEHVTKEIAGALAAMYR